MKSLKQASQEVKPNTNVTNVISDLDKVDVNMELHTFEGVTSEGKDFSYDYMEVNEQKYRVPKMVQQQIKDLLDEKPDLQFIKVKKSGEGINTRYMVLSV